MSVKDRRKPMHRANMVLVYAVLLKNVLFFIEESTTLREADSTAQVALKPGHSRNNPISPPNSPKLYP